MKQKGLFILSALTLGWTSHLYLREKMKNKIKESSYKDSVRFDIGLSNVLAIPIYVALVVLFTLLAMITFLLFVAVFGSWFIYTSLIIGLLVIVSLPVAIYIAASIAIQEGLSAIDGIVEPTSKNDEYLYRRILNEED